MIFLIMGFDVCDCCVWVGDDDEYCCYYDEEWGILLYGDCVLFEKMLLEGF